MNREQFHYLLSVRSFDLVDQPAIDDELKHTADGRWVHRKTYEVLGVYEHVIRSGDGIVAYSRVLDEDVLGKWDTVDQFTGNSLFDWFNPPAAYADRK